MAKRVQKKGGWTPEDRARHKAIREKFQQEKPTLEQLVASGEYNEPVTTAEYFGLRGAVATLRAAREAAGLSLADVEARSGIDKATLSRLETGQNINPTVGTLARYAAALGKRLALRVEDGSAGGGEVPHPSWTPA
jgi:hypothetical protein